VETEKSKLEQWSMFMPTNVHLSRFMEAARRVGADVTQLESLQDAAAYVAANSSGKILVPETALAQKYELRTLLSAAGTDVHTGNFREAGKFPGAGVTFCNFAMADTGTVVLESTPENIRLATTLPEKHFVLVDPSKILEDNLAAAGPMTQMHSGSDPKFIAYITGPSRTADIERVLTIGCHGPREVHILVVDGISSDFMEI
jgi:L-lactate dehydrogenase complex protein LldG